MEFSYPDSNAVSAARSMLASEPAKLFIDGAYAMAVDGRVIDSVDPGTGEVLGQAYLASERDIDRAVQAADRALRHGPWQRMTPDERSRLIWRLADLVEAHRSELALVETLDNGMPYGQAYHVAIPMAVDALRYYSGWANKIAGETPPSSAPGEWLSYTRRQPVGVVAAIAAWNFPLSMACGKLAPALAAGCTIVLKPSEVTPFTAAKLGALVQEAGFPAGVINIVPGLGAEAGKALVAHPLVRKISFTGSTAVGKEILAASAIDLKRVTLELGGKSPNIIFADADIDQAIEAAAMGGFFNTGQVCVARSRLFLEEAVYDQVLDGIKSVIDRLTVGNGLDPAVVLGPVVNEIQLGRIQGHVERARRDGARVVAGGEGRAAGGFFMQPTLLANVDPAMAVMREEIFGPVVAATPFKRDGIDEIAALANDTSYGLAASIFTRDLALAHRLAARIDAGLIEVNGSAPMQFSLPYGGFKQSGLGRENGREGIEAFTETKTVSVKLA